ncbi:MAG: hypothetical protein ACRETW_08740 [Stenotrophobium sp.]
MAVNAGSLVILPIAGIGLYYLTTLMIWLGHYLPHRPDSRMRQFHLGGHHTHYPDSRHARSERFHYGKGRNDSLVPQLPWLIGLATALWIALPAGLVWAAMLELSLITAAHSYVHLHFHLGGTWLSRYAWFRRAQATHDIHHDRDVNFMVADHFWDRCFGTFERPAAGAA